MRKVFLRIRFSSSGFLLVEALLASASFGFLVIILVGVIIYGRESAALSGARARAVFLAEEGLEVFRNMRDQSFSNLVNGTHGLSVFGGQWVASGTQDVTDIFTRSVEIGTLDAKRKQATSTVTWIQNGQRMGSVVLSTIFTNWRAMGIGDWSLPNRQANVSLANSQSGWKVQVQGDYAYVVRNTGTNNFYIINISSSTSPYVAGFLNLSGAPENISVSGSYAYIASQNNSEELQVIDISNPSSPFQVASLDLVGNANGKGIFIKESLLVLTRLSARDPEFFVINIAVPVLPVVMGSLDLSGDANEVVVLGSVVVIASGDNGGELQLVDISNPIFPQFVGLYDISGNFDALSVDGVGTVVVLGRKNTGIYIFDIANQTTPLLLSSLNVGGGVNDLALTSDGGYAFLATDAQTAEFQVIDLTNTISPFVWGSFNVSGTSLNGVAYDAVRDRAYIVGASGSDEFIVMQPTSNP